MQNSSDAKKYLSICSTVNQMLTFCFNNFRIHLSFFHILPTMSYSLFYSNLPLQWKSPTLRMICSAGEGELGEERGEIPEPVELHHKNK